MLCVKRKISKKRIPAAILWLLTWCGLVICLFHYAGMRRQEKNLEQYACYLVDAGNSLLLEGVEEALDGQEAYQGAYCLLENEGVYGEDVRRKISMDVVVGNAPWGEMVQTTGTWIPEDSYGCLLSRESMYELFGTGKADGQKIQVRGCDYYVRGVILSDESFALLPYSKRNAAVLGNVTGVILKVEDEAYRDQYADEIRSRIGVGGQSYYIKDYTTYFGRMDAPKTGTQIFDYRRWYAWIQQQWYRKLYHNKDVLERYYYHFTWRHIRWQSMFLLCVVVHLAVVRYLIVQRQS